MSFTNCSKAEQAFRNECADSISEKISDLHDVLNDNEAVKSLDWKDIVECWEAELWKASKGDGDAYKSNVALEAKKLDDYLETWFYGTGKNDYINRVHRLFPEKFPNAPVTRPAPKVPKGRTETSVGTASGPMYNGFSIQPNTNNYSNINASTAVVVFANIGLKKEAMLNSSKVPNHKASTVDHKRWQNREDLRAKAFALKIQYEMEDEDLPEKEQLVNNLDPVHFAAILENIAWMKGVNATDDPHKYENELEDLHQDLDLWIKKYMWDDDAKKFLQKLPNRKKELAELVNDVSALIRLYPADDEMRMVHVGQVAAALELEAFQDTYEEGTELSGLLPRYQGLLMNLSLAMEDHEGNWNKADKRHMTGKERFRKVVKQLCPNFSVGNVSLAPKPEVVMKDDGDATDSDDDEDDDSDDDVVKPQAAKRVKSDASTKGIQKDFLKIDGDDDEEDDTPASPSESQKGHSDEVLKHKRPFDNSTPSESQKGNGDEDLKRKRPLNNGTPSAAPKPAVQTAVKNTSGARQSAKVSTDEIVMAGTSNATSLGNTPTQQAKVTGTSGVSSFTNVSGPQNNVTGTSSPSPFASTSDLQTTATVPPGLLGWKNSAELIKNLNNPSRITSASPFGNVLSASPFANVPSASPFANIPGLPTWNAQHGISATPKSLVPNADSVPQVQAPASTVQLSAVQQTIATPQNQQSTPSQSAFSPLQPQVGFTPTPSQSVLSSLQPQAGFLPATSTQSQSALSSLQPQAGFTPTPSQSVLSSQQPQVGFTPTPSQSVLSSLQPQAGFLPFTPPQSQAAFQSITTPQPSTSIQPTPHQPVANNATNGDDAMDGTFEDGQSLTAQSPSHQENRDDDLPDDSAMDDVKFSGSHTFVTQFPSPNGSVKGSSFQEWLKEKKASESKTVEMTDADASNHIDSSSVGASGSGSQDAEMTEVGPTSAPAPVEYAQEMDYEQFDDSGSKVSQKVSSDKSSPPKNAAAVPVTVPAKGDNAPSIDKDTKVTVDDAAVTKKEATAAKSDTAVTKTDMAVTQDDTAIARADVSTTNIDATSISHKDEMEEKSIKLASPEPAPLRFNLPGTILGQTADAISTPVRPKVVVDFGVDTANLSGLMPQHAAPQAISPVQEAPQEPIEDTLAASSAPAAEAAAEGKKAAGQKARKPKKDGKATHGQRASHLEASEAEQLFGQLRAFEREWVVALETAAVPRELQDYAVYLQQQRTELAGVEEIDLFARKRLQRLVKNWEALRAAAEAAFGLQLDFANANQEALRRAAQRFSMLLHNKGAYAAAAASAQAAGSSGLAASWDKQASDAALQAEAASAQAKASLDVLGGDLLAYQKALFELLVLPPFEDFLEPLKDMVQRTLKDYHGRVAEAHSAFGFEFNEPVEYWDPEL